MEWGDGKTTNQILMWIFPFGERFGKGFGQGYGQGLGKGSGRYSGKVMGNGLERFMQSLGWDYCGNYFLSYFGCFFVYL